jgi:hypothetical protein
VVRCNGLILGFSLIYVQFRVVIGTIQAGDDASRTQSRLLTERRCYIAIAARRS